MSIRRLRLSTCVVGVESIDRQAASRHNRCNVTIEVAAAGESALHGVQSPRPLEHSWIWRTAVFDKVKGADRAKDALHLSHRGRGTGILHNVQVDNAASTE